MVRQLLHTTTTSTLQRCSWTGRPWHFPTHGNEDPPEGRWQGPSGRVRALRDGCGGGLNGAGGGEAFGSWPLATIKEKSTGDNIYPPPHIF